MRRATEKVKVFVRTRPTARPYEGIKVHKDGETITVDYPKDGSAGPINNQPTSLAFKFDGVLENASQEAAYDACAAEAVDAVLRGYNATICCYGQTGAGKTFTMAGDRTYAHRGVLPRALHYVFRNADLRSDRLYRVRVSLMEIHNESLYDLLAEDPAASSDRLAILDDDTNTVFRGLTRVEVASEEEALAQYFLGCQGLSTAEHALNASSSRSHALFTVHLEVRTSAEASESALLCKLHLVDLAGSERIKKTQAAEREQLRSAACINKSLSFLEQVVVALGRRDAHVPFRQSKLTAALRDALGGNCKTVMVANLWPEAQFLDECVSTLRFASRVRCLETAAVVNKSADEGLALARAERQIRELRQELAMRDMLSGRGRVVYDDLSEGEQQELQQLAARYLAGSAELDELPADSLKRIRETYKAFKAVAAGWAPAAGQPADTRASAAAAPHQPACAEPEGVGDVDVAHSGGFCVGMAPSQARPAAIAGAAAGTRAVAADSPVAAGSSGPLQHVQQPPPLQPPQQLQPQPRASSPLKQQACQAQAQTHPQQALADRNALFSKYKHAEGQGRKQAEQVRQQQQLVTDLKQQLKELGSQVNSAKAEIDALGAQAPEAHAKAAKARYHAAFDELKELRGRLDLALNGLAAAKQQLLEGFEAWAGERGVWLPQQSCESPQQLSGQWCWASGTAAAEDELEPGELFERQEMARVAAEDPESMAFHAAQRRCCQHSTGGGGGGGGGSGGRPGAATRRAVGAV